MGPRPPVTPPEQASENSRTLALTVVVMGPAARTGFSLKASVFGLHMPLWRAAERSVGRSRQSALVHLVKSRRFEGSLGVLETMCSLSSQAAGPLGGRRSPLTLGLLPTGAGSGSGSGVCVYAAKMQPV